MIALKKISPVILSFLFMSVSGIAQEKKDIGIIISSPNSPQLAFEYRKPLNEKYRLKLGLTYGQTHDGYNFGSGEITSVADSMVIERFYHNQNTQGGIRAGFERRFGSSMFSWGADLNVDYRHADKSYHNQTTFLLDDGTWGEGDITTQFPLFDDPTASLITQHYIVPSFRLNINMDVPVGKYFLINLAASQDVGLPIYMGATNVTDPLGEFIGTPPSVIDAAFRFSVGLRYKLGARQG